MRGVGVIRILDQILLSRLDWGCSESTLDGASHAAISRGKGRLDCTAPRLLSVLVSLYVAASVSRSMHIDKVYHSYNVAHLSLPPASFFRSACLNRLTNHVVSRALFYSSRMLIPPLPICKIYKINEYISPYFPCHTSHAIFKLSISTSLFSYSNYALSYIFIGDYICHGSESYILGIMGWSIMQVYRSHAVCVVLCLRSCRRKWCCGNV